MNYDVVDHFLVAVKQEEEKTYTYSNDEDDEDADIPFWGEFSEGVL